ncbi:hypothetical protein BKA56DRAFT_207498 [Ilyonectria sp. MPI-CAGE-AT-0026]|nr:hypothetical protein BKA56DRAFT_207498 [Ilyonectria sp. MPI-CAGE-AT-0026]
MHRSTVPKSIRRPSLSLFPPKKNLDSNTHHDAACRVASLVNFPRRVVFSHLGYERRNFRPATNLTLRRLFHPLCRLNLLHRNSTLGYNTSGSSQSVRSMAVYAVSSVANLVGVNIQGPISPPTQRIDPQVTYREALVPLSGGKEQVVPSHPSPRARSSVIPLRYHDLPACGLRLVACHGTGDTKTRALEPLDKYLIRVIASLCTCVHRSPILQPIRSLLIRYPG